MRLALLAAALLACNSSSNSSGSGSAPPVAVEIGPEGGSVVAADGTRIDVPEGALGAPVTLTLHIAPDAPPPSNGTFVGTPYALEPAWLQFARPVSVTLTVDPSQLPGGASLEGVIVLAAASADAGYFALPSAPTVGDPTHVTARTTHFSLGATAVAGCAVQCETSPDPAGSVLGCSSTCVGHTYALSCAGPPANEPCTCAIDGTVTAVADLDAGGGGAVQGAYTTFCDFPSTSWTGLAPFGADAGDE